MVCYHNHASVLLRGCTTRASARRSFAVETRLPVQYSREHGLERLKGDVDQVAYIQFEDIEALNAQIGAELGAAQPHGGVNVRKAGFERLQALC